MKTCKLCTHDLPVEAFYKDKGTADGLNAWCRECEKGLKKDFYDKHPGRREEYARRYRRKKAQVKSDYATDQSDTDDLIVYMEKNNRLPDFICVTS